MNARDLVIEILGTDDGVEVSEFAAVFGGGVSVINYKNPGQYRILLESLLCTDGKSLTAAIHESFHCKRSREGVEIYKKHASTWSVKERHEEEYNVTLLTEGYLHRLLKGSRIDQGQFEAGMKLCRSSRKVYTVHRIAVTKGINKFSEIVGKGILKMMPKKKREEIQEMANNITSVLTFDND